MLGQNGYKQIKQKSGKRKRYDQITTEMQYLKYFFLNRRQTISSQIWGGGKIGSTIFFNTNKSKTSNQFLVISSLAECWGRIGTNKLGKSLAILDHFFTNLGWGQNRFNNILNFRPSATFFLLSYTQFVCAYSAPTFN